MTTEQEKAANLMQSVNDGQPFVERRQINYVTRPELEGFGNWLERVDNELKDHLVTDAKTQERLDNIERDLAELNKNVKALLDVWTQTQGAARFAKMLFFIIGPIVGAGIWIAQHVTVAPK